MTREDEIRTTLTKEEAIHRIEELGQVHDATDTPLDVYDQLLACESIAKSTPVDPSDTDSQIILRIKHEHKGMESSLNGNDSYRLPVNTRLSFSKRDAITKLKTCTYRTNPSIVAELLEEIFSGYSTKPGHWFYIAQHWAPRPINRVINYLIKLESPEHVTVRNPAAYFTRLIKKREERKCL